MRAQAHTVEAFVAAVLIIGGLVFATQATAVTPLSASTSNQHIETQQQATVEGLLATAARDGTLQKAVLDWNVSGGKFPNGTDRETYAEGPPNEFGTALDETLLDRQIAFNVNVHYTEPDGDVEAEPIVEMGEPSDNAVSATRAVALYDTANLTSEENGNRRLGELDDDEFYAVDVDADSRLFAVVEVEVVAWRK